MAEKDPRDANRRVDFSEAGEGVQLILRNSGIRILSSKWGEDWYKIVEIACATFDVVKIEVLLDVMGYTNDVHTAIQYDELDHVSNQVLSEKLMDAFSLAMNGRTLGEQYKFTMETYAALNKPAAPDPSPPGPVESLESSEEEPTGPDSIQANSTL